MQDTQMTDLDRVADDVESLLWEQCRSPEGLIYCFVMESSRRRVGIDDIAEAAPDPDALAPEDLRIVSEPLEVSRAQGVPQYLLQGIPLEDVEAYEDSLTATAQLLSALCLKYQVSGDRTTLARCGGLFEALESVYLLGKQEEPGWIPKPYGFRNTGQSSMDNQCPFAVALVRYHALAGDSHRSRVERVLVDQAAYWMRHRYCMHVPYFGMHVDYLSHRFYPGHWPLLFLPQLQALSRITGDRGYHKEYEKLLSLVHDIEVEPEYLISEIRCFHRWFRQYVALLEFGAEPKALWAGGLASQLAAVEATGDQPDPAILYAAWRHGSRADRYPVRHDSDELDRVIATLGDSQVSDYLYRLPASSGRLIPPLAWRSKAIYTPIPSGRLELFWQGRSAGDW